MIREWIQKTHLNTLAPLPSWLAPLVLNRTAFMIGETNLRICGNARLKRLPSASSAQRCPKVAYDLPRNAEAALLPGPSRMRCFARPCEIPTCGLFYVEAEGMKPEFSRVWAMPSADTFDVRPIGDFVKKYLKGVSVDPFARNKQWATYTNDLNPNTAATHHMDAVQFLAMLADQGIEADTVIFDPPYSPGQIAECYRSAGLTAGMRDTQNARLMADCRREILRLCKLGTNVLSFGWNSVGMGPQFAQREILMVCHGGAHNDTICIAEEMVAEQASLFEVAA